MSELFAGVEQYIQYIHTDTVHSKAKDTQSKIGQAFNDDGFQLIKIKIPVS